ncbi:MAG: aspartyl beta-hydroxylase [Proteobacteria bacterium]|nr:aspartyl beta-hydroxylase [Pseudomonadota bacterium]
MLGDASWTAELADIRDHEVFAARLMEGGGTRGLAITVRQIRDALHADPLGLSRFAFDCATEQRWPPTGWLPIHVNLFAPQATVDWAYVGAQPLSAPFFAETVQDATARPLNQLIPYRMTLSDFVADAPHHAAGAAPPAGFIFHMSRCGSTLVSQMLAQSARHIVLSEAAPFDAGVRMADAGLLRALALAYGRRRSGIEQRLFIKLDTWHAMALPLFEQAFSDVPWVFLFRDPVEVLVSQAREPGPQLLRQFAPPALYGLEDIAAEPDIEYAARALGRICGVAADALPSPRGMAVNYRDLPGAAEQHILPHFGVSLEDNECAAMRAAVRFDAKMPSHVFAADSAAKQAAAPPALRDLADRTLREVIGRLDTIAARRRAALATLL